MREDTEVWTAFLKSGLIELKEVWYDVRVGTAVKVEDSPGDLSGRISRGLTRKRIDCVARVGGGLWIIEVKPRANMYAVGQVITYARLFSREYDSPGAVQPVIICGSYDEDLLDEFDELGVLVIADI